MISTFPASNAPHPLSSFSARSPNRQTLLTRIGALSGRTSPLFGDAQAEDLFSQVWKPGLLDELHEPLSRYHE